MVIIVLLCLFAMYYLATKHINALEHS